MRKQLLPEAEGYARTNVRRRIWRRFVRVMACIVVFCTTYALILPAITLERNNVCGLEEHTHSDSCYTQLTSRGILSLRCSRETLQIHDHTDTCYGEDGTLCCGMADFLVHEHNSFCLDETGALVCTLPVIREHVHEDGCFEPWHLHTESCYISAGELVCELEESEGHSHDESCSEAVLICEATVEPHEHAEGCYEQLVCELPEDENHTHDESCSGSVLVCDLVEQPHEHGESCHEIVNVCGLEESEGHTHEDACYAGEDFLICEEEEVDLEQVEDPRGLLICEEPEIVLHSHTDECYEITVDEAGNELSRTLICEETVIQAHFHGESCLVAETVPVDTETVTCGLEALHVHGEGCYDEADELVCTEPTEAHLHGENCYDETGALVCTESTDVHVHTERCYGTWVLSCQLPEHAHSEECKEVLTFYCGLEEHTHAEGCTDEEGNLICELEEHIHEEACLVEQVLSDEDQARVDNVIALIEPLPTYDEIMAKLDEFYEADDTEGEEAYLTEVYAQVEDAYRAYMALPEELREYVTNADKLMELEFIWSRVTLEVQPTIVNSGTWTGNLADTFITNEVVYQFENNAVVTMNGTIVIGSGGKLTILGSGSIVRSDSNTDQPLILVLAGGELVIGDTSSGNTSTQKDNFIIDGRSIVVDASTTEDIYSGVARNGWGAAIYSMGKVTLVNTTVQNNKNRTTTTKDGTTTVNSVGGGLYITNTGSLTLDRCAILGNTAGVFGGGFYSQGPVVAQNTEIGYNRAMTTESGSVNRGRGAGFTLSTATAIATFDNVDVHDNVCMYYGGGGQVDGGASLTLNSGTFQNNAALLHGAGALHVTGNATFIMNGGTMKNNTAQTVGGAIHSSYSCTLALNAGSILDNTANGRGGGVHINTGGSLTLGSGITISGNHAYAQRTGTAAIVDATGDNWSNIKCEGSNENNGYGGGVLIDSGTCTVAGATVTNNTAEVGGGGIALVMLNGSESGLDDLLCVNFTMTSGNVSGNTTNGDGAGVYLMHNKIKEYIIANFGAEGTEEYNKAVAKLGTVHGLTPEELLTAIPKADISGGVITGNVAQNDGGGAYQEAGTTFTISGTALFEENEAANNGGAVYIDQGTAEIIGGTMNLNSAGEYGGALYLNGNVVMSDGNITNNTAKNAGGIYVAGGSVTMTNGKVTGNTATENGGAVYVANTSVTFGSENGTIEVTNNSATNGAGFYLNQSGGAYEITISNGQITDNTATGNGGGIYQTGSSAVCTISGGGSVSSNTAANGGGFYIHSGAMNVNGGYVVSNHAVGTPANTTAYVTDANAGVGGGIYLNSGSYIMTAESGEVGLYGNVADFAADDVYAAPTGTTLKIPEVADMNLTNFGQKVGTVTDWFEDYATADSRYESGLRGGGYTNSSTEIMRYRKADNEHKIANKLTSVSNTYICLTLGFEMDYTPITVKKIVTSYDGSFTTDMEFLFEIRYNDGIHGVVTEQFTLKDQEEKTFTDILTYSDVTVTELSSDGFTVTVQVFDSNDTQLSTGLNNTVTVNNEPLRHIVFTNCAGYELPSTGGAGTTSYTMGGLLLVCAAVILLYIHDLKRRKEERPSF